MFNNPKEQPASPPKQGVARFVPQPTRPAAPLRETKVITGKTSFGMMFVIHVHTGRSISDFSYFAEENEVLLPPDRKFRVQGLYTFSDFNARVAVHEECPYIGHFNAFPFFRYW